MLFSESCALFTRNYCLDNIMLQRVVENHDLGITFDSTLSFKKQYLNISKKLSLALGFSDMLTRGTHFQTKFRFKYSTTKTHY